MKVWFLNSVWILNSLYIDPSAENKRKKNKHSFEMHNLEDFSILKTVSAVYKFQIILVYFTF